MNKGMVIGLVAHTAGLLFMVWVAFYLGPIVAGKIGMNEFFMKLILAAFILLYTFKTTRAILNRKDRLVNELIDIYKK